MGHPGPPPCLTSLPHPVPTGTWDTQTLPAVSTSATNFLMLDASVTGGHTYFISFRAPIGYDAPIKSNFAYAISVHYYDGGQ